VVTHTRPNVLITGASGLVGSKVLRCISTQRDAFGTVVALDVREVPQANRWPNIHYVVDDICNPAFGEQIIQFEIDTVVHLAAILAPIQGAPPDFEYRVDVLGTENVVKACAENNVDQIIHLSSGAAYGYHADNPVPLRETDALRGNDEFPYSRHKRLAEEMLCCFRRTHPALKQLILRPGTILGANMTSPVSAIFEGKFVLGIVGADSPFVIILDEDVAEIIVKGIRENLEGAFNLAGDGVVTLRDIARYTGKLYLSIPASLLKAALWVLRAIGASARGPEAVGFLRYRPVLSNEKLKETFGYTPSKTSAEAFSFYLQHQPLRK